MPNASCPQCGGPVELPQRPEVFLVCPWCRSTLSRTAETLRRLGSVAELTPDVSPFQVGTRGRWQDRAFELIGRIRRCYTDGQWNEWCLDFSSGDTAWLAEAQGQLFLSTPLDEWAAQLPDPRRLQPGHRLELSGANWLVTDVREARIAGAEGYLPFNPSPEDRLLVDLVSSKGGFLHAEVFATHVHWYRGQVVNFDDLAFTHLRELDGWRF